MMAAARFGEFEVDLQGKELRRRGIRLQLSDQSFEILALLVERPGQIVSRDDICQRLWPDGTVVEYEHSVNSAVNRLRSALGDSAGTPRFVETVPRMGYRFLQAVETIAPPPAIPHLPQAPVPIAPPQAGSVRWLRWALVFVLLLAVVTGGVFWYRSTGFPSAPRRIQSIAVLPLANLSRDSEQAYFAEGMTEELITALAQIKALSLISRTSVMRYGSAEKSIRDIRRELGVDAVVEGAVQRSGGRVRITAQLIDTASGRHLWAGSYERELNEVLSLQAEVARSIAEEIRIKLTPEERERLTHGRPVNPEAYEAYLKGRHFSDGMGPAGRLKAIGYLEEAVRIDPEYALAWAVLGERESQLFSSRDLPLSDKVKREIRRAIELDDQLAEAHVALGHQEFYWNWNWVRAEAEYRRAIELDPGSVDAQANYALCQLHLGRKPAAIEHMERARRLSPLSPVINSALGEWLRLSGYPDRALAQLRKSIDLDPGYVDNYTRLGSTYEDLRNPGEALTAYLKARSLNGASPEAIEAIRKTFRTGGIEAVHRAEAEGRLVRLKEQAKRERVSPRLFAAAYAALGDKDRAIQWLEEAFRQRCSGLTYLKVGPAWEPLRSDPRFEDLLRRMNFPP